MKVIKTPRLFWEDCVNCDCDVPSAVKKTKSHVWIEEDDAISELIDRATMYADHRNGYWDESRGLVLSARATLKSINEAS